MATSFLGSGGAIFGASDTYPAYGQVGPTPIPYAADFISAAGITSSTQQNAVRALVTAFLQTGLLDPYDRSACLLKTWWPVVGAAASAHAVNLVDPTAFHLTFFNNPAHTASGIAWDGATQYAETGLNPAVTLSAQEGVALHYYSLDSNAQGDVYEMGSFEQEGLHLSVHNTPNGGTAYPVGRAFLGSAVVYGTSTDGRGLYSIDRLGSATTTSSAQIRRNGVANGSAVTNTSTPPNVTLWLGALHYKDQPGDIFGPSSNRCAGAGVSVSLTNQQHQALYAAVQQFNTTLNRAV